MYIDALKLFVKVDNQLYDLMKKFSDDLKLYTGKYSSLGHLYVKHLLKNLNQNRVKLPKGKIRE